MSLARAAAAVMVTRSGRVGEQLAQSIQLKGFDSWHIPTLKIQSEELLIPAEDFQQAIFVSPNAVKYSVVKSALLKDVLPDELIAVGQGTADSLRQAGFEKVVIPTQFNSEGLLTLPQLQTVVGQQILIVKGRGGRLLLESTLRKRGAVCHSLEVYCRVTTQIDGPSWNAFLSFNGEHIVTIASNEAMSALTNNLDRKFKQEHLTLVVASQRIKENALHQGYQKIIVAESAANDEMLSAIIKLVDAGSI